MPTQTWQTKSRQTWQAIRTTDDQNFQKCTDIQTDRPNNLYRQVRQTDRLTSRPYTARQPDKYTVYRILNKDQKQEITIELY